MNSEEVRELQSALNELVLDYSNRVNELMDRVPDHARPEIASAAAASVILSTVHKALCPQCALDAILEKAAEYGVVPHGIEAADEPPEGRGRAVH